jgi:predicted transcriptional regulator
MSHEPGWDTKFKRNLKLEKIVDYILLAEFDIDSGSTLKHQYPNEIPDYKPDWFAEHMLPEGAHNRETDYTYIFLNRDGAHIDSDFWIKPRMTEGSKSSQKTFLYGLNFVKTKHDQTVRRGAILKSMCIFSRYSFIEAFKKPLELALEDYFNNPSVDVLQHLFTSLNSIDISKLQYPTYLEQLLMRRGVVYDAMKKQVPDHLPSSWNKSITGNFNDIRLYLSIPVHRTPDEVGDLSVTNLVKLFGESTMRIYHAVLTKQRVMFVGYNHAASDIAQMVLSSVAMVCPPMTDIIRRTFPYCTLSDLSFLEVFTFILGVLFFFCLTSLFFLQVPGFIAGVTNPMFQQREAWWDLLCVLDIPNGSGFIYSAEDRKADEAKPSVGANPASSGLPPSGTKLNLSAVEDAPHYLSDAKFIQNVISGINARIPEDWVRQQFYDYTVTILSHAQEKNMLLNANKLQEKTKKFLESNAQRIAALEVTSEFRNISSNNFIWATTGSVEEKKESSEKTDTKKSEVDRILLKTYIRKLLNETNLDPVNEVMEFYKLFLKSLTTESSLQVLLTMLPESQGGLVYLASGLFHSSPTVRYSTTVLLQRIQSFPSTKGAFNTLNDYLLLAYQRQLKKVEDNSLSKEMNEEEEFLIQQKENEKLLAARKREDSSSSTAMNNDANQENEGDGDILQQLEQGSEKITAVFSSALSTVTQSEIANDISQVAEQTTTALASIFQQTLEMMQSEPDPNQDEDSQSDSSENIAPSDLIP